MFVILEVACSLVVEAVLVAVLLLLVQVVVVLSTTTTTCSSCSTMYITCMAMTRFPAESSVACEAKSPAESSQIPTVLLRTEFPRAYSAQGTVVELTTRERDCRNWANVDGAFPGSLGKLHLTMAVVSKMQRPQIRRRIAKIGMDGSLRTIPTDESQCPEVHHRLSLCCLHRASVEAVAQHNFNT